MGRAKSIHTVVQIHKPVAVATWHFGKIAVEAAAKVLAKGGAIDACEAGVNAVELDTQDQYFVGYGGLPNAEGVMELDAAIMDGTNPWSLHL
jgi:isoaspartyl peptidase/L-asparaginase-like protein (Ntn-hydrolase superfamily)